MAPNKKTKTSFAEGLKAQAEKLAPAKVLPEGEESALVDLDGVEVIIPRGDLSDEDWANVLKRRSSLSKAKEAEADPKNKDLSWGDVMDAAQNMDQVKGLISPEERKLLEKTNEWDRAEFIRQRMKNKGYKVPINSAQDERDSIKGKKPSEREPEVTPDNYKPSGGTQTEMSPVSDAGPGMSPLANAMQMATGATPSPTGNPMLDAVKERVAPMEGGFPGASNPAPVTGGFPGLAGGDVGVAQANAKGAQHAAEDTEAFQALNPMTYARKFDNALTEGMSGLNQTVVGAAKSADALLTPQQAPNEQQMAAREDLGLDPYTAEPGLQSPAPMSLPPPPEGPGSASLSMGIKEPGGFKVERADPEAIARHKAAVDAATYGAQQAKVRIETEAASNKFALDETVKLQREKMEQGEILAKEAAEIQQTHAEQAQRHDAARMSLMEEARKVAADPINPNRYWNNKSEGQKAAAVIAGALFGFTGQGMQWLQRLDGLVEADNRLQASDRASNVEGLKAQAQGLGEAAKFAMARGATLAEAKLMEKAAKYESAKAYLDQMRARTDNAQLQMKAAEMSAGLDMKLEANALQSRQLATMEANGINSARAQNAQLARQSYEFKLRQAGAAGGGEQVRGPQAMELGALAAASQVANELKSKFGDKNILSRFLDKGAALFPGTDAKNYNLARGQAINMIAPMMGAGVLQKHDLDRWESLMANAGDVNGEEMLNILVTDINRLYNEKRGALEAAGYRVQRFPVLNGGVQGGAPSYAVPR